MAMQVVQYTMDYESGFMIVHTNNGWMYPYPYGLGMCMRTADEELFNKHIIDAIMSHVTGEQKHVIARTGSGGSGKAIPEFLDDDMGEPHPYIGKHWLDVLDGTGEIAFPKTMEIV